MNRHVYASLVLAILAAAPATAQNGAMWVSPSGEMTGIIFRGGDGPLPSPMDRAPAEMARLFKALCLDGSAEPARFGEAARDAGVKAAPIETVGGGKKPAPVTLDLWSGDGLVVSRSEGNEAVPTAQCNATFYVSTLPDKQMVTDAVSAEVGLTPSNLAAAIDKKGKPKRFFNPEWTMAGPAGARIVTAFVDKGNHYMPGNRVQISIRTPKASQ
ncbi:MAG: hypothetical protein ABIW83_07450 [Allosphingosinicella sp.]